MSDPLKHQRWADRHLWEFRPLRDLFWIALVVFLLILGYVLRAIFTPVLIALVLAYLFTPVIDAAERRYRMPRALTISLILAGVTLAVLGFVMWLGPIIVGQVRRLVLRVPEYIQLLEQKYGPILGDYDEQLAEFSQTLRDDPMTILYPAFTTTSAAFGFIGDVIEAGTYVAITLLLIPLYFFFFALYFHPMMRRLKRYIPASGRERTLVILRQMDKAVSSFFRGRLIIGLIMAVMFAIGWSPLLTNVPYWLLLALLTGLLSLIPYAAGLGWIAALLLKAMELATLPGSEQTASVWLIGLGGPTLVFLVVQFIEGWLLTPWIQGRTMDLSAVGILLAIFVGGALGGLYGMILAVPVLACAKILLREVLLPKLAAWAEAN